MVRSLLLLLMLVSCDEPEAPPLDGGTTRDSAPDGGSIDAEPDAGSIDAEPDAGSDPYCADELPSWSIRTSSTSAADDVALADDFAAAIEREAAAIDAALASDDCAGRAGIEHIRALFALGDTERCLAFAAACLAGNDPLDGALGAIAFVASRCADMRGREQLALDLLDRSTAASIADECNERTGRALSYAAFAVARGHEDQVDAILARAPSIDTPATRTAIAFWAGIGGTIDDLRAFATSAFAGDDPVLAEVAAAMWLYVLYRENHLGEIRAFIRDNVRAFELARSVFGAVPYLYGSFYASSQGIDFSLADRVYRPFAIAAAPTSWLPSETNTHTYTELYQNACRDGLLGGADLVQYRNLVGDWMAGTVADRDALAEAEGILAASGEAAELLTFIGTLLERMGSEDEAVDRYFRAHLACIHYNRSHWALRELLLWQEIRERDDYAENNAVRAEVLAALGDVPMLASYASNYSSLSDDQIDSLKYAVRFWVPYLDVLIQNGASIYVKHSFQLLSEVPGLESIRDTRIDYPEDYRLWDDVRGVGGNPVAVDVNEMRLNPYGEYNLAAHEIAHQMETIVPPDFTACLNALYDGAISRDRFVNYYAALNPSEYFAEGIVAFLIPSGAPPYFGPNQQWLADNDPDLLALIEQLNAATPIGAILCPI